MCKRYTGSRALFVICMLWHLLLAKKFPLYAIQFPRILPETSAYLDNLYCKNKTFFFLDKYCKNKTSNTGVCFFTSIANLCAPSNKVACRHIGGLCSISLFSICGWVNSSSPLVGRCRGIHDYIPSATTLCLVSLNLWRTFQVRNWCASH